MDYTENHFSVFPRMMNILINGMTPQRKKEGINLTQEKTLMMLSHHRGETLSEVSRYSELDKGALSRVLKTLEQRSFIRQERDTEDRRSFHLFLTDEGEMLTEKIRQKLSEHFKDLTADLTKLQSEKLHNALSDLNEICEILESKNRK